MTTLLGRRIAAILCLIGVAVAGNVRPNGSTVRTEDRNHDSRPDVWRTYEAHGQLLTSAIDTNFDGRSDVREYFSHGQLQRRESDRDFDGRVDLVEEFDPSTHEQVRSVADVDFDGTADLLILLQGGRPVFSRWADRAPAHAQESTADALGAEARRRMDGDGMAPLSDPFRADVVIRGVPVAPDSTSGSLSTSRGLPSHIERVSQVTISGDAPSREIQADSLTAVLRRSPRGPPVSLS
jgi:hypothetical protein